MSTITADEAVADTTAEVDLGVALNAAFEGRHHERRAAGRAAAEQVITLAKTCPVPEIARFGRTLVAWRTEYLARFDNPALSNGPTENLNLKIKNTKRIARGYRSFANYRLRLLLNHGLIRQDQQPARIRPHRPRLIA